MFHNLNPSGIVLTALFVVSKPLERFKYNPLFDTVVLVTTNRVACKLKHINVSVKILLFSYNPNRINRKHYQKVNTN
jgi:hypothetical protein